MKLLLAPLLLLASALIAGLYGAFHNQVSYTVSPDYFHTFKFVQFAIPEDLRNRWGAAWVGVRASWWMGAILGVPVLLLSLRVKGAHAFIRTVLMAALTVAAVAILVGLMALTAAVLVVGPETVPPWIYQLGLKRDAAIRFLWAAVMHDAAYAGALIGAIAAGLIILKARRTDQG
ncbi:MAG: hypothetical protein ACFB6R_10590 [Alphaproteobacteria bacterium]